MEGKLIKKGEELFELFTQGFLKGSTNHELIDSLNAEEGNVRYKISLPNCQEIERGYDLDELANEKYRDYPTAKKSETNPIWNKDSLAFTKRKAFKAGFQKALELIGDKKFTEEDMVGFSEYCRNTARREGSYGLGFTNNWELCSEQKIVTSKWLLNNFIQSLQQTEWDVVIEMENGCLILKRK